MGIPIHIFLKKNFFLIVFELQFFKKIKNPRLKNRKTFTIANDNIFELLAKMKE